MVWGEYALAFTAFLLTHSMPIRPPIRPWLVARLSSVGFGIAYSALSIAVLAWLIGAAGRAPHIPLWHWAPWQNDVVLVVMVPVSLILALAIARPNPFSFGGAWNESFDPLHPGIVRLIRHPLLLALALWASSHVLANGDLAHAVLFGSFAGFAVVGMSMVDRRKQREMGETWYRLDLARRQVQLLTKPASWWGAAVRLALGLGLYCVLLWLHPRLFGISPLY